MSYEYKEVGDGHFRVAHLKPGDGPIFVEVSVEDLVKTKNKAEDKTGPKTEDYDALSWQWGSIDHASGNMINIKDKDDRGDYKQIVVTSNLLHALRSFRQTLLWVDMICINQANTKEKERQVARMAEIYKGAQQVYEELDVAVKSIDALGNLDDVQHIGNVDIGIRSKAGLYDLEPLFKLLRRGWFSRRWIVQEIGVARKATVYCGNKQFNWEKLTNAVALLERIGRDGSIDGLFKLRPESRHVSEYMGNISALPAYRLVQNVSGLYRRLGKDRSEEQLEEQLEERYTLEQLVCFLVIFQSSEPKDIIYAVLGIASDVMGVASNDKSGSNTTGENPNRNAPGERPNPNPPKKEPFPVQYEGMETLQVYTDFVERAMKNSKSLDILCRPWAPKDLKDPKDSKEIELPSWIFDLSRKPFQETARGKMVRYNPDPFVGPAVRNGGFYTASRGSVQDDNWFKIEHVSKTITVEAFRLAAPDKIWDVAVNGSIPASWLSGVEWKDSKKPPPDELWRTLVADRTNAGHDPEPGYPSIIQSAVREKGVHYGINTNEFIHEKDNLAYYEVFRRVQAVVWNRKLIRTKLFDENHRMEPLGLVPPDTEKDDVIYIVNGCSVPLVLRKNQKNNSQGETTQETTQESNGLKNGGDTTYTLIGECYISNMMDGRAMPTGVITWERLRIEWLPRYLK
ncbi:heterokaryon incompatibility protein-domain-containing protein [Hypoxylon crocopeplum]|nr:heterokaryon incompatibility protein-domain-containing protein [Hypoxylon crocopeplum]